MTEKRIYPRIISYWPLFLATEKGQKRIGYIKNISLSGALLFFSEDYELETGRHKFSLKLKNQQLKPEELTLTGLKEWVATKKNEVHLALALEELEREKRSVFVRFLSRSDKLHIEAVLLEIE